MKTITKRIAETSLNIPEEYLSERPPFPKKVKIEITNQCNLKCIYCQHTYDQAPKQVIDKDFLFSLLSDLKKNGVEEVGLFWMGEPLMHRDLPEFISYAKGIGIEYVFITSNALLASRNLIKQIFDSGLDSLKFSLNASSRDRYLTLCGIDAFDLVVNNIKESWKVRGDRKKPSIYASSIYDPSEAEEFDNIQKIIGPYVDEHYPLRLYGSQKLIRRNGNYKLVEIVDSERRTIKSMLPCWPMFTEPHISCDGFMSACYCDRSEKFFMGNLKEKPFMDIWHSEKFVTLRRQHLEKKIEGSVCENCIAYAK